MIELNKELYKKNLDYGHRWDAAIESRGDSPFSDARVFLALAIKLIEKARRRIWRRLDPDRIPPRYRRRICGVLEVRILPQK